MTCQPAVSIPANAHGISECTPVNTDCSKGTKVYTDWTCDRGYVRVDDECILEPNCPKGCSDLTAYAWEADSVIEHGYVDLSSGCAYTVYGSEADECLQSGRCTTESGCVVRYRYKNIVCDAGYHPKKVSTGYVGCEAD